MISAQPFFIKLLAKGFKESLLEAQVELFSTSSFHFLIIIQPFLIKLFHLLIIISKSLLHRALGGALVIALLQFARRLAKRAAEYKAAVIAAFAAVSCRLQVARARLYAD